MKTVDSLCVSEAAEPRELLAGPNNYDGRWLIVGDEPGSCSSGVEVLLGREAYGYAPNADPVTRPVYAVLGEGWERDCVGLAALAALSRLFGGADCDG